MESQTRLKNVIIGTFLALLILYAMWSVFLMLTSFQLHNLTSREICIEEIDVGVFSFLDDKPAKIRELIHFSGFSPRQVDVALTYSNGLCNSTEKEMITSHCLLERHGADYCYLSLFQDEKLSCECYE
ncbi:hypothetical protein Q7C_2642 [Methylophaga frappieri]|uniref:Uncharacterized protein n=1 Tax=Methylophaga frappieri (strain ATCC BAA-2434 / DSM 25690 / JAM7) TaxID=754477 RepID=I1YLH0_METFJ|nr:hypothetical protein [Methylophaga frappieri]AFJ03763.1 hypothetical protein Q7C_2642 [Methylophaga frappieri]